MNWPLEQDQLSNHPIYISASENENISFDIFDQILEYVNQCTTPNSTSEEVDEMIATAVHEVVHQFDFEESIRHEAGEIRKDEVNDWFNNL